MRGSIPALVTPFSRDLSVDEEGLRRNVEFQIENGSSGLVTVGTTGESPTVTPGEHKRITEIAADQANGRVPVIAGTGSNSTDEAIEYTKHAEDCGADASLQVSPYYNKPTQEGLYRHFKAIADAVDIPVILYNIQGRTAVNIEPETMLRLSKIDNIVGVKEASGSIDQVSKILMLTCDEDFVLLSGDDSMTLPMMALGGVGVISVVANIVPSQTAELVKLCEEGNFEDARKIHYKLLPLIHAMFIETNPAPVKFAMNELGMAAGELRLPLVFPGEGNKEKIRQVMRDTGLL
ncbi:MAG: 4-hydroxy-tetrahydrodipicolinate synthase [Candidatus Altiarchaeales archaeon WOR_SM1_86-2]|nr:MAG: 4-hydroxy-tetrahydrodipicolinate synthase [Candidatus Altiarchaeales archaeon WOR_SM1_86-2]ODS36146.1 MAG: 4-hydroxy-tetrahydrodipicolinate synthase [Candidatus Altiarchaeales archaeon WOR_SM1_79]